MLKIEMLPAEFGDCIWIEYGTTRKPCRILIDGGTASTYNVLKDRIEKLSPDSRQFELFIITHIDADHIEGAIKLLGNAHQLGVTFNDIWFNGWKHLPTLDEVDRNDEWLGGVQGEFLSALIGQNKLPWNRAFNGSAVAIESSRILPSCLLANGMKLTIVSPTTAKLIELRAQWSKEIRSAGLDRTSLDSVLDALNARYSLIVQDELLVGKSVTNVEKLASTPFISDGTKANGSSIAVLFEYEGKRCLLTGDAQASVLIEMIQRLLKERGKNRLVLDVLKLPHHGSRGNLSVPLLKLIRCKRYLFSTNGKRYQHPDLEAVARVIVHGGDYPSLYFNYRTDFSRIWDDDNLMHGSYPYNVEYPLDENGLSIEI